SHGAPDTNPPRRISPPPEGRSRAERCMLGSASSRSRPYVRPRVTGIGAQRRTGVPMADQLLADDTGERITLTTDIDLDFAPLPVPNVMTRQLGDDLVLYEPTDDVLFVLDRMGAFVWGCFE